MTTCLVAQSFLENQSGEIPVMRVKVAPDSGKCPANSLARPGGFDISGVR